MAADTAWNLTNSCDFRDGVAEVKAEAVVQAPPLLPSSGCPHSRPTWASQGCQSVSSACPLNSRHFLSRPRPPMAHHRPHSRSTSCWQRPLHCLSLSMAASQSSPRKCETSLEWAMKP